MRSLIFKTVGPVLIVGFWLTMMGLLIHRETSIPPPVPGVAEAELPDRPVEHWYTIQSDQGRVGVSCLLLQPTASGAVLRTRTRMRLEKLQVLDDVEIEGELELDEEARLKGLRARFTASDVGTFRARGEVADGLLGLTVDLGEFGTLTPAFPVPDHVRLAGSMAPMRYVENMEPGRLYGLRVFDPRRMEMGWSRVQVMGTEPIRYGREDVECTVVETIQDDVRTTSWVAPNGTIVRQETPNGLTLVRERLPNPTGLETDVPIVRFAEALPTPTRPTIESPRTVRRLRIRFEGIRIPARAHGGRQSVEGARLTVRRFPLPTPERAERITESIPSVWLEGDLVVTTDVPRIQTRAAAFRDRIGNKVERARAICRWVQRRIRDGEGVGLPSARHVLRRRRGDALGRAVLFAALARGADLPCRVALGLLFRDGAFRYHAWPEVYLGRWVPMDPTLGQVPADATHVRLTFYRFDRLLWLVRILQPLEIVVEEVEHDR